MATAFANRPVAPTVAARSRREPRHHPLGTEPAHAPPESLPSVDEVEEIATVIAGSGIFLIQLCAVLPVGIWRLAALARRSRGKK